MKRTDRTGLRFLILTSLIFLILGAVLAQDDSENGIRYSQGHTKEYVSSQFVCDQRLNGCSSNLPVGSKLIYSDQNGYKFGPSFPELTYEQTVNNFIFNTEFKRTNGAIFIFFRTNDLPSENRYYVVIQPTGLDLIKEQDYRDTTLSRTNLNLNWNDWHKITIAANGGNIWVVIDGDTCICYKDSNPIYSGGIILKTFGGVFTINRVVVSQV